MILYSGVYCDIAGAQHATKVAKSGEYSIANKLIKISAIFLIIYEIHN